MALKKDYKITDTVSVPDAYNRINAFRFDNPSNVWIQIGIYESTDGKLLNTIEYSKSIEDLKGKEFISLENLYKTLKLDDDWKDAIDC